MSEFKLTILRNVGVAALVVTLILSVSLYASLNLSGGGTNEVTPPSTTLPIGGLNASASSSSLQSSSGSTSRSSSTSTYCLGVNTGQTTLPAGHILQNITIGNYRGGGGAYDSQRNMLYVTGSNYALVGGNLSEMVYAIDAASNSPTNITIKVGIQPVDIAYDPDNSYLYVANFGSNSVSVINDTANEVIKNITVGINPLRVAYDPYNKNIYVSNLGEGTVSVINTSSNTLVTNIKVGSSPFDLVYNAANHNMYLSNGSSNIITEINSTNQVVNTFPLGTEANLMVYDAMNSYLYTANFFDNFIYAINSTNDIVGNVTIGLVPTAIGYDPYNQDIYVAGNGTISNSAGPGFLYLINSSNTIAVNITGQGWAPLEIIPNQPAWGSQNTAMYLISLSNTIYVLSNFANSSSIQFVQVPCGA